MKKPFFLLFLLFFAVAGCSRGSRVVPEDFRSLENPLNMAEVDMKEAGKVYLRRCSGCHGSRGRGDGNLGKGMKPPPTAFNNALLMSRRTDGELYYWIKYGKQGTAMVNFSALSDKEIWSLVLYLRSLRD